MVIFAAAIKVLASACEDITALDWEELAKGLVGVGVLLAEVSLFMNTAKFSGQSVTTATGIVILSGAIKILASACEDFAQMNWGRNRARANFNRYRPGGNCGVLPVLQGTRSML